jgi:hypothetical protein
MRLLSLTLATFSTAILAVAAAPSNPTKEESIEVSFRIPKRAQNDGCENGNWNPYSCGWCHYYYGCLDTDTGHWIEPW